MQTISKYFGIIVSMAIVLLMLSAINAEAATFTVTNTNDSGAGSLRQAVTDASTAVGDDVINFDAGFNVPRTITLASLITVNGNGALAINGPGTSLLTISGNNAVRIFEVSGVNSPSIGTITINNLTIANGTSIDSGTGGGAGIGINNGAFDPPASTVNLVVNNVLFRSNNGGVNPGGAIGGFRNCSLTVNNSAFTQNGANGGAAIANGSGIGTCGAVTITNSSFYENAGDTVSLGGNGNGVYTISGSSFYNNGTTGGSRILFVQTVATTSTITNTTFYNNRALGGAIVLSLGTMTMRNVTINRNAANSDNVPGGIQLVNGAILNFGSSILSGNTSPSGENNISTNATGFVSQGYNIIGNNFSPLVINGITTGNQLGINPRLDTLLRDNGGATKTLALRPGSPAIDAGNPTTFPATDQRGITRPQDGDGNGNSRSDIGAFEKRLIDVVPTDKADFDGDGKTDVSIFRPGAGEWWFSKSSDGGNAAVQFGASSDKIVPGDYSGDGKSDFAIFRPSTGFWFILRSEDSSFFSVPFGVSTDVPVPADYDGDGKTDVAVFRPSTQTWFINKSGGGTNIITFGTAGDKPVVGDYDGDGKADIAIFRPSAGEWWVQRSSNLSVFVFQFGASTDKPVQGDYSGDGKTDIAIWRPSNGNWFVLRSEDSSFYSFPFGTTSDIPAPGDYDGDGKTDAAVFRPSNSTWFVNRSTSGTSIQQFGITGDIAVPNAFVP